MNSHCWCFAVYGNLRNLGTLNGPKTVSQILNKKHHTNYGSNWLKVQDIDTEGQNFVGGKRIAGMYTVLDFRLSQAACFCFLHFPICGPVGNSPPLFPCFSLCPQPHMKKKKEEIQKKDSIFAMQLTTTLGQVGSIKQYFFSSDFT